MKNYIPEKKYRKIIKLIPIFCIDFLIRNNDKILLIKRKEEPLKGNFWLPGGRLRMMEKMNDASKRIQLQEIGRYFPNLKIIGFSNYHFKKRGSSRALHTPTILYEINVSEHFNPIIDKFHSDYKWTNKLPKKLIKKINTINPMK